MAEVSIIDNVILHVIVDDCVDTPYVQIQFDLHITDIQNNVVSATNESMKKLTPNDVLILIVERNVIVETDVKIEVSLDSPETSTVELHSLVTKILDLRIGTSVFILAHLRYSLAKRFCNL